MATIDEQVAASSDDAFETAGGVVTLNGTSLNLLNANEWAGFRWTGVDIPGGATIVVAHMEIYVWDGTDDYLRDTTIYGQNANNPGTFTTGASDISNRPRTTNSITLPNRRAGAGWEALESIVGIVQEIVDDNNGAGDALVVLFNKTKTWDLEIRAWDGTSSLAAKLYIEYTAGGPTPGWNQLQYTSEPPTPNAWNQLKREAGTGDYKKLFYEGE